MAITERQQQLADIIITQLGGMSFFKRTEKEIEAFIPSDDGLIITLKKKYTDCKIIFIHLDEGRDEYFFKSYNRYGDLIDKHERAHCIDLSLLYTQSTKIEIEEPIFITHSFVNGDQATDFYSNGTTKSRQPTKKEMEALGNFNA